jgi:hypothetical protein
MEPLHEDIAKLIERGSERLASKEPIERNEQFEQARVIARRWRNLIGEAKFDIPKCLHRYINWLMPESWTGIINYYDFIIEIPDFAKIHIAYKRYPHIAEWYFYQFLIFEPSVLTRSSDYHDLPLLLAIASEAKRPKKCKVEIEEIEGSLADNANLIKVKNKINYVLTEGDFLNNPGADFDNGPIYA